LHAAGSMTFRQLRLIQLHDLAVLATRLQPGDWEQLPGLLPAGQRPWWMFPPLALLSRYYRCVPAVMLELTGHSCRGWLRRGAAAQVLSDVSYSDLRRVAFPGLPWAQSLADVPRYLGARLFQSASEVLAPATKVATAAGAPGAAPRRIGLRTV